MDHYGEQGMFWAMAALHTGTGLFACIEWRLTEQCQCGPPIEFCNQKKQLFNHDEALDESTKS